MLMLQALIWRRGATKKGCILLELFTPIYRGLSIKQLIAKRLLAKCLQKDICPQIWNCLISLAKNSALSILSIFWKVNKPIWNRMYIWARQLAHPSSFTWINPRWSMFNECFKCAIFHLMLGISVICVQLAPIISIQTRPFPLDHH